MYQAHIVVLPKPGKTLQHRSSYRSKFLLNYELKILTKVLATRVLKVLPTLIDIDQTGLMAGKSTDINL